MSYIYEALKRAEDEREHGAVTVRTVARPLFFSARTRWWVWALVGGLAVNAALLLVLAADRWSRPPNVPAAPAAVVVAPPRVEAPRPVPIVRETPVPRAEPRRDVAAPAPRVVEPKRPRPTPAPRALPVPPSVTVTPEPAEPRAKSATPPVATPKPVEPRAKPAETPPVAPTTPEPRVEPAPAESAPDLKLQVHVYSPVASERMVFIAGRRYAEGDTIDADTVLERITPDGAVVRRREQRFELSDRRP